jgi:hypothetical protein
MKDNFSSELFGIIITSIIIPLFIILRDDIQWRSIKNTVDKKIGIELHGIFIELSSLFIEDTVSGGISPDTPLNEIWKTRFFDMLEEYKDKDRITFNEIGRTVILEGGYNDYVFVRKNNLNEIELKYSKFLKPILLEKLIKMQGLLDRLEILLKLRKNKDSYVEDNEVFCKLISSIMLEVFKLIYEFKEIGIEIYWK